MKLLGSGILTWDGGERRSQRYGNIHLGTSKYNEDAKVDLSLDLEVLEEFEGQRVKLSCVVLQDRPSGHIGDLHLGIMPVQPTTGETLQLGVGHLEVGLDPAWDATVTTSIGLKPEDGRSQFWMDPRVLYRLHDQTVALYIEAAGETPCHPAPDIKPASAGVKATGDGAFQVVDIPAGTLQVKPRVTKLGGGMLRFGHYALGESVDFTQNPEFQGSSGGGQKS